MKTAVIQKVTRGRQKGQFKFVLFASNGEPIADSHPETYTQKHSAMETLRANFSDFVIVDQTKEGEDIGDIKINFGK
jgi:uncharacterized protein YegP (UPF0339 family)